MKGKKGIIFGALNEMSIAWKVAERCLEEGAEIVLTNTELSIRMGQVKDFAEKNNVPLIPADATSEEDLERLFKETMELLGGKIDFILHSVAMSLNVRKNVLTIIWIMTFYRKRWIFRPFLSIRFFRQPRNWMQSMNGDRL